MQFRSIKAKIVVLSSLSMITASGALLAYGFISSSSSQAYVSDNVSEMTRDLTKESLLRLGASQAATIRASLDGAFDAARNLARGFEAVVGGPAATPPAERREQLNAMLLTVLKDNPRFNGTYSAWEPNALDGLDADHRNDQRAGSDATGRFLPYWTRDAAGKIDIQPLVEYDSRDLHPNGVMKGGWYIGPQSGTGESILDPLPYIVQGKKVYLATMSVPITVDGRFAGVAGADFDLSFVQTLANEVKAGMYDGKASVEIISNMGLVVASSERPDTIGQPAEVATAAIPDLMETIRAGKAVATHAKGRLQAVSPIVIGRTATPWAVMIDVPEDVALAKAIALDRSLATRNARDQWMQTLVGLLIAGAGVLAMWFVARSIAQPISAMTGAMRQIAGGQLETEIPAADRVDEIGSMAGAVAVFRDNAIANLALEKEAGEQRQMAEGERRRVADIEKLKAEETAHATGQLATGLKQLAAGDLAVRLDEPFADAFEDLRADFNRSVAQLAEAMAAVSTAAASIDAGSAEISRGSDDLSKRTEQQAASLEETAAALDQITANVSNSSRRADEARTVATEANRSAAESARVMSGAVEAMERIERSSTQIANIIGVIDEIAFQTNLLALNAGVEAARAGEAGKGFAVVAQEVRELAQRSAKAAKEIKDLIRNSATEVEHGVRLVSDTGEALRAIGTHVAAIHEHMEAIATSAREQSVGLSEVNTAVNQMDQVTQQNAAMVEETNAASAALASESTALRSLIARFRLAGGSDHVVEALRATARGMAQPSAPATIRRVATARAAKGPAGGWQDF
ncbi:methyl-accepting chemotaxis protein [Rhizobium sp. RU20A]|uniref:methyl-accepting chemotaxis protein n=1 Tax=Rhizobium sp. RU20A TaxID=1907412 RepID=UPI00095472C5|nr:methyl-accepting chemotaxis protein [Rhizobium sp. RU20A]SIR27786.1 methyl-accepting chemotaxis protein [Rhizobium sp. RU20A]